MGGEIEPCVHLLGSPLSGSLLGDGLSLPLPLLSPSQKNK